MGRTEPLEVYAPNGIADMTDHILAAYSQDINVRLDGPEPINETGYKVNTSDIKTGIIYKNDCLEVEAFPVRHANWPEAYGFVFTSLDRKIVISGDTVPSNVVIEKCRGCDILIHEVYSAKRLETRSPEWIN